LHTLKANPQLSAVLGNPIISHTKKLNILTDIFASRVNKLSIAFYKLMINKGRGEVLYTTAEEYINQYDIKKNITRATVVSATPLSAANKQKLLAEVKAAVGGEIDLETKTDSSLIGGFVLTVGDRQVDTSIANTLRKLKKDFASGIVQ
ncbi:MAG: synthase subunit delta, partial [Mucilaginibacter sp.]|nr:synthase subunit delta [Mucilaginibacter sp.]